MVDFLRSRGPFSEFVLRPFLSLICVEFGRQSQYMVSVKLRLAFPARHLWVLLKHLFELFRCHIYIGCLGYWMTWTCNVHGWTCFDWSTLQNTSIDWWFTLQNWKGRLFLRSIITVALSLCSLILEIIWSFLIMFQCSAVDEVRVITLTQILHFEAFTASNWNQSFRILRSFTLTVVFQMYTRMNPFVILSFIVQRCLWFRFVLQPLLQWFSLSGISTIVIFSFKICRFSVVYLYR